MRKQRSATPGKKPAMSSVKVRPGRKPRSLRTGSEPLAPSVRRGLRHVRRSNGGNDGTGREEFRIASPSQNRHLTDKARYVLQLLAVDQRGLTETLLLTYGITRALLANLVHAGLVTAQRQNVRAGGRTMEVVRMRITEAGRRATEG